MKSLKIGESLRLSSGETAKVLGLKRNPGEFWVYNFEVQQYHNYYVTAHRSDPGVLVHNEGCDGEDSGSASEPNREKVNNKSKNSSPDHKIGAQALREVAANAGKKGVTQASQVKELLKRIKPLRNYDFDEIPNAGSWRLFKGRKSLPNGHNPLYAVDFQGRCFKGSTAALTQPNKGGRVYIDLLISRRNPIHAMTQLIDGKWVPIK